MKMIFFASLFLIPAVAFCQDTAARTVAASEPPGRMTKLIRIHYGNAQNLAGLAAHGSDVHVEADNALQAIVLKGKASDVTSVEQILKELDTAVASSRDFELTIWAIGGSNDSSATSQGQMPELLAPVVKQLRAIFPYKNYQVLSTMLIRSKEGSRAENRGVMQTFSNVPNFSHPSVYDVDYSDSNISAEERNALIHLRNFRFVARVPLPEGSDSGGKANWHMEDVLINTDVDLHEGQKVVVGKANVENSDSALFVVLSARLVQ